VHVRVRGREGRGGGRERGREGESAERGEGREKEREHTSPVPRLARSRSRPPAGDSDGGAVGASPAAGGLAARGLLPAPDRCASFRLPCGSIRILISAPAQAA
jgi:hypothetical protein